MEFSESEMNHIWRGLHSRREELERARRELMHLSDSHSHVIFSRWDKDIKALDALVARLRAEHYDKERDTKIR